LEPPRARVDLGRQSLSYGNDGAIRAFPPGNRRRRLSLMSRPPKILVFDSGLGGLTVFSEIARLRPGADYVYCADDAGFPYGAWSEPELVARVGEVIGDRIAAEAPDMVVIACNTASTLVLPYLRANWPDTPFVGTVPAIKPAAEGSQSRMIAVLATPGTVKRDYTQNLIAQFAAHCRVKLVGSNHLARLAEDYMHHGLARDEEISAEIAPCFETRGEDRTDAIVLACTHYPLLLDSFRRLAPWPVTWVDPAPAIARRVDQLLIERFGAATHSGGARRGRAIFTSGLAPEAGLRATLDRYGLTTV
jgi:glutamate racemase